MSDYMKRASGDIERDADKDGEFNHAYATDAGFREQYQAKVADAQRQLPEWLQREVQGLAFQGTPGQGVDQYNSYIRRRLADDKTMLRSEWNRLPLAEREAREQDGWRTLDVGNTEQRIDLRAVEHGFTDPYTAMEYGQLVKHAQRSTRRP